MRDPIKCIVSRANRVGMMYSPIAYASPALFALLTKDLRAEVAALEQPAPAGLTVSLQLLSPPGGWPLEGEGLAFEASRKEEGWQRDKRLRIALFHYV